MSSPIGAAAMLAAALLIASSAAAQTPFRAVLSPPSPPRWDLAGHVTWVGEHKPQAILRWDQWYGAAAIGASAGFHVTPHLKLEMDAASSTEGEIYEQERIDVPGAPFPIIQLRDHHFRTSAAGASVVWQFLENRWVHPFVAAGATLVRESGRIEAETQTIQVGGQRLVLPPSESFETTYTVRPAVTAGAKFYLSDRAFIRTDVRTSFADGSANLGWRSGIGFDF